MYLRQLRIQHLRNIASANLEFDPSLNLIIGENGSGKTSLLEAIYLIGTAKSFRSQSHQHIIQGQSEYLLVFARLLDEAGQLTQIGIEKSHKGTRLHINSRPSQSSAELASHLALQLVNQSSFQLIDQGPRLRRRFLDWGLFHVKPRFFDCWKRYYHVLKQRNSLLKQHKPATQLDAWNLQLAQLADELGQYRHRYIEELTPIFVNYLQRLGNQQTISLRYSPGWNESRPFLDVLQEDRIRDSRKGFTHSGPHRADLGVFCENMTAEQRLSRGQQKTLVTALQLAQAEHLHRSTGKYCIVLVDDLAAELDSEHQRLFIEALADSGSQVFITATDADEAITALWPTKKVFHVKRGNFTEVVY